MNDELQRVLEEEAVTSARYYPDVRVDGLRKITEHLTRYTACPDRDSK
jgi:hypothetical protein